MASGGLDFFHILANAGPMVKFVLLLLLFFSVTSWAIIFVKYFYLRKAFSESLEFTEFFWKKRDFSEAFSKTKSLHVSPVAQVFRAGYMEFKRFTTPSVKREQDDGEFRNFDIPVIKSIERALSRGITAETAKLHQLIPFLATTGSTAPFIGLFGTVWGIMNSFHGIGMKGSVSLAVVAPGISEALVATAAGLAAAIPAVVAFNYFTQKIRFIESEMRTFASDFLNIIERQIHDVTQAGRKRQ